MKIIVELRIQMPLSSSELEVGLRYTTVQAMYEEAGDGTGTEFVYNQAYNYPGSQQFPFRYRSGQYTYKIHKAGNRLPWWVRSFIGGQKAALHEESWNSYPFFRTVFSMPDLLRDKFSGILETLVVEDDRRGNYDNVFNLGADDLEKRLLVDIDISEAMFDKTYNNDPTMFKSAKTGRGPLDKDWKEKTTPIISIYELLVVELDIPESLVPDRAKAFMIRMAIKLTWKYYRKMFCSLDEWIDLTMEDTRKLEKECAERLPEEMNKKGKDDATSFT